MKATHYALNRAMVVHVSRGEDPLIDEVVGDLMVIAYFQNMTYPELLRVLLEAADEAQADLDDEGIDADAQIGDLAMLEGQVRGLFDKVDEESIVALSGIKTPDPLD